MKKLLQEHLSLFKSTNNIDLGTNLNLNQDMISGNDLRSLVPQLLKTDVFAKTKKIVVYDKPWKDREGYENKSVSFKVDRSNLTEGLKFKAQYEDGTNLSDLFVTAKLSESISFAEVVELHSIVLSPKIYDVESIKNKTGVWIYPTVLDSNCKIKRKISIVFSPEQMQDLEIGFDENNPISDRQLQSIASIEKYLQECSVKKEEIIQQTLNRVEQVLRGSITATNIPAFAEVMVRVSSSSLLSKQSNTTISKPIQLKL